MSDFRLPPALAAAEPAQYAPRYGESVRAMDRATLRPQRPRGLIDLTHGDTRAFPPPALAESDSMPACTTIPRPTRPTGGASGSAHPSLNSPGSCSGATSTPSPN